LFLASLEIELILRYNYAMNKKFYITTAIDYVNDTIHIGHIFQKLLADVLARYYRQTLGKENVFFLTGTDEYGQKAEKAAQQAKTSTKEFVDKISKSDQAQQDSLKISYDRFIRTTESGHKKVVQEIWQRVKKNGDIYLGEYSGLYCEGCEAYYTEKDLIDNHCPLHSKQEIKKVSEKNYFFRWSKYKNFLIDYLKNNHYSVIPLTRKNELLEFVKDIKDIPISRANFTWGIPVPNDSSQVIYVWFDALINYLTGIGFLENKILFKKFWPADIHILGKDNARWHALLWPAMLKSAGFKEFPKTVLVNGFLTLNNQKISKSAGNIVRPTDWVKKYGVDAVRYYLLRYTIATEDSDISEDKLRQAYNADLANGLGNLVARVAKLCENNNLDFSHIDLSIFRSIKTNRILEEISLLLNNYRFDQALAYIWGSIKGLDEYLDRERPWQLTASEAKKRLGEIIKGSEAVISLGEIAEALQFFLPETAEKILKQFQGPKIKAEAPLFPRLK